MSRQHASSPAGEGGSRAELLAWVLFLAVCAATYCRIYFGISFTDEAYYSAIPYRFALGDLPFRDEATTLFSGFSFLTYPFFKLYHAFAGSDGIVLFARHLDFIFALLVAWLVYRMARRLLQPAPALLLASCQVAFIPFNIQGLGYNMLACGLLTAGLFAGAVASGEDNRRLAALAGFLLALCVVAYPPMLIAVAVALLCLVIQQRRVLFPGLLGALGACLLLAPLLAHARWDTVTGNLAYVLSIGAQGGALGKLASVLVESFSRLRLGLVASAVICLLLARLRSAPLAALAALVPLILAFGNKFPRIGEPVLSHGFLVAVALTGPFLYAGAGSKERRFFLAIWPPSAVAALVMGYSSSNGYHNAGIGFLPGALVSLSLLAGLVGGGEPAREGKRVLLQLVMLALAAGILVHYQYKGFYSEAPFVRLTTTVSSGPYSHLRTTPAKARFVEQLGEDVSTAIPQAGSIVFYYDFPAGYLFSDLRPATNAVWLFSHATYPRIDTGQLAKRYAQPGNRPDLIVRFTSFPILDGLRRTLVHEPSHPIDSLLSSGEYRPWKSRDDYLIYRRTPSADPARVASPLESLFPPR